MVKQAKCNALNEGSTRSTIYFKKKMESGYTHRTCNIVEFSFFPEEHKSGVRLAGSRMWSIIGAKVLLAAFIFRFRKDYDLTTSWSGFFIRQNYKEEHPRLYVCMYMANIQLIRCLFTCLWRWANHVLRREYLSNHTSTMWSHQFQNISSPFNHHPSVKQETTKKI